MTAVGGHAQGSAAVRARAPPHARRVFLEVAASVQEDEVRERPRYSVPELDGAGGDGCREHAVDVVGRAGAVVLAGENSVDLRRRRRGRSSDGGGETIIARGKRGGEGRGLSIRVSSSILPAGHSFVIDALLECRIIGTTSRTECV